MSRFKLIILALTVVELFACHHSHGITQPQCEFMEPNPLIIEFKANGQFITDSLFLAGIKIQDLKGDVHLSDLVVSDIVPAPDGNHRFVTTVNLPLSSTYGTTNWVVLYPDGS